MVEGKECRWSFLIGVVNSVSGMRIDCERPPAPCPLVIGDGSKKEQLEVTRRSGRGRQATGDGRHRLNHLNWEYNWH